MLIAITAFIAGIIIGRYYKVVKNEAQLLNDIERIDRILKIKDNNRVNIISPSKINDRKNLEKNLTNP